MGLDEIRFGASYADVAPLSGAVPTDTAAPTFSPDAGNYTGSQSVTLTSTTPGAAIRYTTDGSTPTSTTGALYSGAITVSATTTVKAIAYSASLADSSVSTATFTISAPANTVTVRGDNAASGEGVDKLTDGNLTTKWLDFSATSWVRFSYLTPSVWNGYAITSADDAPERDPKNWTLSGSNDGTTWTLLDTRNNQTWAARGQTNSYTFTNTAAYSFYKWDITANGSGAIIQAAEFTFSNVGGPAVVATPTFTPAAGTYTATQSVTISTATAGASIRYTTDGSTPTSTTGTVYSGAISVSTSQTIRAIAYKSAMTDSAVASAAFTINSSTVVATPVISPGGGTYTSTQSVMLSSTTAGAAIRYTTDGSTPTSTTGTLYSGAISVGTSQTIKAIAYKSAMTDSAVASAAYVINLSPTTSIAILDPSFEINTGYNNYPAWTEARVAGTGWTGYGGHNNRTFNTGFAGQVGGNALQLIIENGTVVGSTPSELDLTTTVLLGTYQANTTYTFTVAAGTGNLDDTVLAQISLLGNSGSIASTFSKAANTFAAAGALQDITTSFTTGASGGFVGQNIYLRIGMESSNRYGRAIVYDNLRLGALDLTPPANTFATWAGGFSAPPLSAPGPLADPDGDGLANLIEYVLGSDPRFPGAGGPSFATSGSDLVFAFDRADASETADIAVKVAVSTDLVDWTTLPSYTVGANNASSTPGVAIVENSTSPDRITVTIPLNSASTKFAKLVVVATP